jgi:hypothetical protein
MAQLCGQHHGEEVKGTNAVMAVLLGDLEEQQGSGVLAARGVRERRGGREWRLGKRRRGVVAPQLK